MTITGLNSYAGSLLERGQKAGEGHNPLTDMVKEMRAEMKAAGTSFSSIIKQQGTKVPYANMIGDDGMIHYKGVTFTCNEDWNAICLGDVSDPAQTVNIPLENGGLLKVNRDNLGDLSQAIGMFSPADVNAILRVMNREAHAKNKLQEIEETENSIGRSAEERL